MNKVIYGCLTLILIIVAIFLSSLIYHSITTGSIIQELPEENLRESYNEVRDVIKSTSAEYRKSIIIINSLKECSETSNHCPTTEQWDKEKEKLKSIRTLLNNAEIRLRNIQSLTSDKNLKEEIQKNLEQLRLLVLMRYSLELLTEHAENIHYENNYGSSSKAEEFTTYYNTSLNTFNFEMKKLEEISN